MQVQRLEFKIKRGCMDQALAMMKENARQNKGQIKRIYKLRIGRQCKLAVELEWENLAEYDKQWAAWDAAPGAAEGQKKLDELVEEGSEEIWISVPF